MTAAGLVAADPAAIRDFFERLYPDPDQLPPDARVGIWRLSDLHTKPFDLHRPDGLEALVAYAAARAEVDNLYLNTCLQPASLWKERPTARGEAATALAMAGLVVDLDYGTPGHAAATNPPDAAAVLAELPRAVPLRPTLLVHSGHGLYAWWLFKEPLLLATPAARKAAATLALRLQHTIRRHWQADGRGWHLDSTADLARCLRFPGAINRKPGLPPVGVRLLDGDGPHYDSDDFDPVLLDDAFIGATFGATPSGERGEASARDAAFPPADLDLAEAHCAFLRHARDDAPALPYDQWLAALTIWTRCADGERLAHARSAADPARYDRQATQDKLGEARKLDPYRCTKIHQQLGFGGCAACPLQGKIKNPLQAGRLPGQNRPTPEPGDPRDGAHGGLEDFAEADVARVAPGARRRRAAAGPAGPPDDGAPPPGSRDAPAARGRRAAAGAEADALEPWGDPVPLEADAGAAQLPGWPADVLPEELQAYVEAVARTFQVAPDLVAVSLLGVLAIAVQRKVQAEPQPDWVEQLPLWACPIGESGSRRSAVLARVAAPLQRYETERRAREQEAADASESKLRMARGDLQQAERDKSRAADALAKAQGSPSVSQAERAAAQQALEGQQRRVTQRLEDVRAAEAALVKPPRLLIEDATVEAASTVLAEQGERIGIVSSEGDFFENLGARFGKQVPVSFWAKCYTGDRHVVDRRGGGGPDGTRPRTEVLERPCLSMVLSPQPVVLGELRDRRTLLLKKGIMARFVYAVPASRVGYRELHPEALRGDVEQPWHAAVGALLALDYAQGVGAVTGRGQELPHRLHFTEAAGAALDAFRADVERRLRPGGDLAGLGEWAHKYVGHVVRIAALLHLAQLALLAHQDREEGGAAVVPTPPAPVTEDAVARAVALAPYLAAHARAALGLFADAAKTQGAAVIKTWLEARPRREFSQRDAHQACRRHFDGPDEVAEALDVLEAYGYVQDVPDPVTRPGARWGRPKRRRLLTNPIWLPDPPPPDAADAPASPTEYAGGTFENGLSTGKNGSALSGSGTFEDAEYGEYAPHGGQPPAASSAGDTPPATAPDAPLRADGATEPRTQRAHRTQNSTYQEGIPPAAGVLKTSSKVPERTQKSAPAAPAGAPDAAGGPFAERAADDPARLAYGAAQRHGFPYLRLRSGRTFGPDEGGWWRDVGRAEGERDPESLYRVVRHLDLGEEDGPATHAAGAAGD